MLGLNERSLNFLDLNKESEFKRRILDTYISFTRKYYC